MLRYSSLAAALALAILLFGATNPSAAQGVVLQSSPVISYYQAPVVSYYPPPTVSYYSAPATVSYYSVPTTTYYVPPVVSYYAPPVASYVVPGTAVTTYRYGILPWRRTYVTSYGAPVVIYR